MTDQHAWRDRAYCRTITGSHNEAAFAERGGDEGGAKKARLFAKLCNTMCPVREECLATAMAFEVNPYNGKGISDQYRHGIWGGLTPLQRARLNHAEF